MRGRKGGGGDRADSSRLLKMACYESRQLLFEFHSSRKITSLTRNKEDSTLTVSFGSYSFMS